MEQEQILRDLSALPPSTRQLVTDFIAFLRMRYAEETGEVKPSLALREEPFVGMWRDREDMADSSEEDK